MKVALLHPGAMGATVAQAAVAGGQTVFWVAAGRTPATRRRAEGLAELGDLAATAGAGVDAVISVCPPEAALALADAVLAAGFRGLYVDANAVAPATARRIADRVTQCGARFVDGGIIGPPALQRGTTRLYLSGCEAVDVARWFEGSMLEAIVVNDEPGAASALKMAYAAWTKGTSALLLAVAALAEHEGVGDMLRQEWDRSQRGLSNRLHTTAPGVAGKAWRFVGEMEEIASSFAAAGLSSRFHEGATESYARLAEFKGRDNVQVDEVIAALLR